MPRITRREALHATLAGVGAAGVAHAAPAAGEFAFRYDHVLGTSLDLWVSAPDPRTAWAAEDAVLDEIERLRLVFSLYHPRSELSRLNRAAGPVPASADLLAVLREYDTWEARSGGACSDRAGAMVEAWQAAERVGSEPPADLLAALAAKAARPGWCIDAARRTVTRLTDLPLNLNSVAKGYVIGRAVAAARAAAPAATGLLVNLGGDMLAWGNPAGEGSGWAVGVQNPRTPAENAAPLTAVRLANAAVATSGGYERFFAVGGRRYSHLIDPRTGRPAAGVLSATVVAPDSVTANALATTLAVLSPAEGLRLVAATPGAECLIVPADGAPVRSPGFAAREGARVAREAPPAAADGCAADAPWPAGFQVSIGVELPAINAGKRYRRPYVAVWVEDAAGKSVRTVTEWGNNARWLRDLSTWWKFAQGDPAMVKAVSRATRAPGKYEVVWDGKDDKGQAVPQGTYTVKVEVHREHGKHLIQTGAVECLDKAAKVLLEKNEETGETVVQYKKK